MHASNLVYRLHCGTVCDICTKHTGLSQTMHFVVKLHKMLLTVRRSTACSILFVFLELHLLV
jgi:hypothetical protein